MGIAPDVLIRDRYRLLERIAVGSTGEVWRALDLVLTRHVAVKILHPEWLDDRTFRERFRAEARHAARLSHPGVAEVHDYGEQGDLAFLVMEYLPGQSLEVILEHNRHPDAAPDELALSLEATLEIVAQVARALQAAHDLGLVHRDIKPANLIVGPSGDVKITDFGTARALDAATVTEPGVIVGTAQYLSPEQAEGRTLTPASDIYTLGIVAYRCLTGDPPFGGPSPVEIAAAHVNEQPPPLPESVPAPVRALVESCLAKDPADRPASAAELAGQCVASRAAIPRAAHPKEPKRRRPAPVGAAAAGAALAVGGMALLGPGHDFFPSTPVAADGQQVRIDDDPARPHPVPGPVGEESSDTPADAGISPDAPDTARSGRGTGDVHPYPAAPETRTSTSSTPAARGGSGEQGTGGQTGQQPTAKPSPTGGSGGSGTSGPPASPPPTSGEPDLDPTFSPFRTDAPSGTPFPFGTPSPSRTTLEGGETLRPSPSTSSPGPGSPAGAPSPTASPSSTGSPNATESRSASGSSEPADTTTPSATPSAPETSASTSSAAPTSPDAAPESPVELVPSVAQLLPSELPIDSSG